ncbi:MAG: hypothetical protein IPL78_24290 [Chloroflexi bacterium]|nr:hypothetical protein [Chloroflexota bacterium]
MHGKAPDAAAVIPTQPDQLTFTNAAAAVGLTFQHGAFRWGMSGDPVAMMGGGFAGSTMIGMVGSTCLW